MRRTPVRTSSAETVRAAPGGTQTTVDVDDDVRRLAFNPRLTARALAAMTAAIIITGALANYAVYNVAPYPDHPITDVLRRFDLGHEPSVPAFYSASVMLASAAFLVFLGWRDRSGGPSRRRYWYALSFLFLCLAIDETVMFHEMGTAAMHAMQLGQSLYFSWILPGLAFAVIVGLVFRQFLMSLNRRTRTLLMLSGVVFLAGALGMELVAGILFSAAETELAALRSVSHVVVQAIEEALEMAGVAIFLYGLVDYANVTGLDIVVQNDASRRRAASE